MGETPMSDEKLKFSEEVQLTKDECLKYSETFEHLTPIEQFLLQIHQQRALNFDKFADAVNIILKRGTRTIEYASPKHLLLEYLENKRKEFNLP